MNLCPQSILCCTLLLADSLSICDKATKSPYREPKKRQIICSSAELLNSPLHIFA